MKHFFGEINLDRVGWAVFLAAPAIPAFILVFNDWDFLSVLTVDNVPRAKLVTKSTTFDTKGLIDQDRYYRSPYFPNSIWTGL